VTMALMASASLACLSVLTSSNPCDVHTHGGAAVATAAPRRLVGLAARLACCGGDAFELGGACACCPWSRSCWYGWGGSRSLSMASPRRLAAGRQAALASPRHGGTARGWTVSRPPTRGGRYFMNAHARLPIEKLSSSFAPAAVRLNVGRSTDRSSRKL